MKRFTKKRFKRAFKKSFKRKFKKAMRRGKFFTVARGGIRV